MIFLPLIERKRDGGKLSSSEISEIVRGWTASQIPDYQLAAFLMAVFFRGMDPEETRAITLAMRDSGKVLTWPPDARAVVDKHSTGGVGDKVSLPLAPLLACLGFRVPMISGRGLGITGGTLDKLDSIPGFKTSLTIERIKDLVQEVGCVICSQTEQMAPADRHLYALRDVTGTVPSIPLIVASILSKKLAEGLDALVLDVKFGAAAFMQTFDEARQLAQAMVNLGTECGVNTRALLTDMNSPLGHSAGNWLEIKETALFLQGREVARDLLELVVDCAANLLVQSGKEPSLDVARASASQMLASGEPQEKWEEMLGAQGADLTAYRGLLGRETLAAALLDVPASTSGSVSHCDARVIGEVVRDLGGGRLLKDSRIYPEVGLDQLAAVGSQVKRGDLLGRIHARSKSEAEKAAERVAAAFTIMPAGAVAQPRVRELLTN